MSGRRVTVASPVVRMPSSVLPFVVIVELGTVTMKGERLLMPIARLTLRAHRVAKAPATSAWRKVGDMWFISSCHQRPAIFGRNAGGSESRLSDPLGELSSFEYRLPDPCRHATDRGHPTGRDRRA